MGRQIKPKLLRGKSLWQLQKHCVPDRSENCPVGFNPVRPAVSKGCSVVCLVMLPVPVVAWMAFERIRKEGVNGRLEQTG